MEIASEGLWNMIFLCNFRWFSSSMLLFLGCGCLHQPCHFGRFAEAPRMSEQHQSHFSTVATLEPASNGSSQMAFVRRTWKSTWCGHVNLNVFEFSTPFQSIKHAKTYLGSMHVYNIYCLYAWKDQKRNMNWLHTNYHMLLTKNHLKIDPQSWPEVWEKHHPNSCSSVAISSHTSSRDDELENSVRPYGKNISLLFQGC